MDHSDTLPPYDIPGEVLVGAMKVAGDVFNAYHDDDGSLGLEAPGVIVARAIMAERERAIAACEAQREAFRSTEYAFNQPLGSLLERFACDQCIEAIRGGQS